MDKSFVWTKLPSELYRAHYATVLEPVSRDLWVLGGYDLGDRHSSPKVRTTSSDVLIMPLNPSLQDLAIATVARTHCLSDPRLAWGKFPPQFRDAIEEYRREVGGKFSCTKKDRCFRCSRLITCMVGLEPRRKKAKNE